MSLKSSIINAAFDGVNNPFKNIIEYAGNPDNVITIDSSSPYGAGTMSFYAATGAVYYKTYEDATSWILLTYGL